MTQSKSKEDEKEEAIVTCLSIFKAWQPIQKVWHNPQVNLPEVVRWKNYCGTKDSGGARTQNSLQHTHSISRLCDIFIVLLRPYVQLDESLLKTVVSVHDEGEGEIGMDTLFIDKSESIDLLEYKGFLGLYGGLRKELFDYFHKAFLLQFALKNPANFPEEARSEMRSLAEHYSDECHVFDTIERFDYVLYALEQFQERGNEVALVQTLRNQVPKLNQLADNTNIGIGEVIWTADIRDWAERFIRDREGKWIEQKS